MVKRFATFRIFDGFLSLGQLGPLGCFRRIVSSGSGVMMLAFIVSAFWSGYTGPRETLLMAPEGQVHQVTSVVSYCFYMTVV